MVSKPLCTSWAPGSCGSQRGRGTEGGCWLSGVMEAAAWKITSSIRLRFNVKTTRAIPWGLGPDLGTVLKCETLGSYGRLQSGGPCAEPPTDDLILPGCTHKPLQAWGPLSTVVPLYFWSVFWIVLSSSHRWNFSVSSSCLGRNGRQKGMHFSSTKICRARIIILLWGTFQQLAGEKLVSETLESLLHGL